MYRIGWIQTYPVKTDNFTLNNRGFFRNILYRGITENMKQKYINLLLVYFKGNNIKEEQKCM